MNGGVGNGGADGDVRLMGTLDATTRGEGGVLGRAVAIGHREIGMRLPDLANVGCGEFLAPREQVSQPPEHGGVGIDQLVEQAGCEPCDGDLMRLEYPPQLRRLKHASLRREAETRAIEQRTPYLKGRRVKRQGAGLQYPVVLPNGHIVRVQDQARHRPLFNERSLGDAGGAGGVDHISET